MGYNYIENNIWGESKAFWKLCILLLKKKLH